MWQLQVKKLFADCALLLAHYTAVHKQLQSLSGQRLTRAICVTACCRGNEGMMAARPGATSCRNSHVCYVVEQMSGEEMQCQRCICPQGIGRAPSAHSRILQVGRSAKTATNHRLGEQLPFHLWCTVMLCSGPRLT